MDRSWPPALKEGRAWPLKGLRQAFLDGTLTRPLNPEGVLRKQIVSFVERGEFGLGSGLRPDGQFERAWWKEAIGPEEVLFDETTFLLTRAKAGPVKEEVKEPVPSPTILQEGFQFQPPPVSAPPPAKAPAEQLIRLSLRGQIPPEQWNRLGTSLLPRLRTSGQDLPLNLAASLAVKASGLGHVENELRQALRDLGLEGLVRNREG